MKIHEILDSPHHPVSRNYLSDTKGTGLWVVNSFKTLKPNPVISDILKKNIPLHVGAAGNLVQSIGTKQTFDWHTDVHCQNK